MTLNLLLTQEPPEDPDAPGSLLRARLLRRLLGGLLATAVSAARALLASAASVTSAVLLGRLACTVLTLRSLHFMRSARS